MRRLLILTLVTALLPAAAKAYCPPEIDNSVAAELERSQYVMTAKVLSETWLDDAGEPTDLVGPLIGGSTPLGMDPYSGADYRVEPVEVLKGYPPPELLLFSENSTARFPMEVGATYLLFVQAYSDIEQSYFYVDNCANSGLIADREAVLDEVRQLGGMAAAP